MLRFKVAKETTVDQLNGDDRRFDLGTTKFFYNNNEVIGYIDYFIVNDTLFLKNLEVATRRKGFGSLIIKFLFNNLDIKCIQGYSVNKTSDCFWKSLNVAFNSDRIEGGFILNSEQVFCKSCSTAK